MTPKNTFNLKIKAPKDLIIIERENSLYHYARVISNTRFGHMPISITYCKTALHVKYCIDYCRENNIEFRVRSGGHQHEGMCSGNNVVIIDLSEMNAIEYIDSQHAWIPVGKQLGKVYEELESRSKIIPGGGCQSVNVGGLTQGCGWGLSIRKFGFTCDNILECEIVLADGSIVYPSSKNLPHLFWALKGGGGGNFGIVTKFKFKLSSLAPVTTSFALRWEIPEDVKSILKLWTNIHSKPNELTSNLSTACSIIIINPEGRKIPMGQKSVVAARMGGLFYGSKTDLISVLKKHFKELIPEESEFIELEEHFYDINCELLTSNININSLARHQNIIANFLNPTTRIGYEKQEDSICKNRHYRILPDAPTSSCDRPHPHKITSGFPKILSEESNNKLVDNIYSFLANTCFYSDVNKYMSFHCLGGAVTKNTNSRVFPYHDKPYILQIQCWWDDAGNAFTNQSRNKEYVKWVENFRKQLSVSNHIEGAFINFIDQSLVENPETPEGRLKLLTLYYGKDNLDTLRNIKSEYDKNNMFNFAMSIPLV